MARALGDPAAQVQMVAPLRGREDVHSRIIESTLGEHAQRLDAM